ncbi:MAG: acetylornithine transaminase [Polyangiaceae bacterium]
MEAKSVDAEGTVEREAELLAWADRHLLKNYRPQQVIMERGEGSVLIDTEGRRYLDFCAGVAVCALGHAHPALTEAIARQAAQLVHVSNYFYNRPNVELARALCEATGYDRAFFCNSGTEANEAMLKLARRYHHERGEPRSRIIAFHKAFHGRTMGALALTGNPAYMEGFGPHVGDVEHVDYGDLDALRARMNSEVAAIIIEPVQGEGGVNSPPAGFLEALRPLADEHGALLLLDEVQTGVGRTGQFLASQTIGLQADAVSLAKGLGGGFPVGALVVTERVAGGLPPGAHGSTFGGNPLASAAALCVLEHVNQPDFLAAVRQKGAYLADKLAGLAEAHPRLATGERGQGLLRALVVTDAVAPRDMLTVMREHGLLVTAAGRDGLRFTPPLVVTEAEIDEAVARADRGLTALEGGLS